MYSILPIYCPDCEQWYAIVTLHGKIVHSTERLHDSQSAAIRSARFRLQQWGIPSNRIEVSKWADRSETQVKTCRQPLQGEPQPNQN